MLSSQWLFFVERARGRAMPRRHERRVRCAKTHRAEAKIDDAEE